MADSAITTECPPAAELEKRRVGWARPPLRVERGVLAKYAKLVRSASEGAVTG